MMLVLLAVGVLGMVVGLLCLAVWAERRMHVAAARMVIDPRWSPEEAESIVARELANMFTRQQAVRAESAGRRSPFRPA
jgi:hypothetical protein